MCTRHWTTALRTTALCSAAVLAFAASPVEAQSLDLASVELVTGHAGYIDETWDNRIMVGGLLRVSLTPRFAVGPEVVYLHGPDSAHELLLTGTATYDLVGSPTRRRLVPFIVFGAGLARRFRSSAAVPKRPGSCATQPRRPRPQAASARESPSHATSSFRATYAWGGHRSGVSP